MWLAALAACNSATLRMYADRKGWNLGTTTVEAEMRRDAEGAESVQRRIGIDAALSTE
ncbi:MAG: OsmC family protein [Burkholderiales bacterium]